MLARARDSELTEDMLRHVLRQADHVTHGQLRFGIGTGARTDEIEDLKWSEVDLVNKSVWFSSQTSSSDGRVVPLPPNIVAMLWDMKAWATSDLSTSVWDEVEGIRKVPLRTRWRGIFQRWAEAYDRGEYISPPPVSVPPICGLRRFAIQLVLDRGVCPAQVSAWAGETIAYETRVVERSRAGTYAAEDSKSCVFKAPRSDGGGR